MLLQIVVEPMGRNNFATAVGGLVDQKGLLGNVTLSGQVLSNWEVKHLCFSGNFTQNIVWEALPNLQKDLEDEQQPGTATSRSNEMSSTRSSSSRSKKRLRKQGLRGGTAGGGARGRATVGAVGGVAGHGKGLQWDGGKQEVASLTPPGAGAVMYRGWLSIPGSSCGRPNGTTAAHWSVTTGPQVVLPGSTAAAVRDGGGRACDPGARFPPDSFINMSGWEKGLVWVNGQWLGRYWQTQGPQNTMYVPGCWLRWVEQDPAGLGRVGGAWQDSGEDEQGLPVKGAGVNEIVVLELGGARGAGWQPQVTFVDAPDFSGPPGGPHPLN